jgi:hypothetical protein
MRTSQKRTDKGKKIPLEVHRADLVEELDLGMNEDITDGNTAIGGP